MTNIYLARDVVFQTSDLMEITFHFLDAFDFGNCARVNKHFRQLTWEDRNIGFTCALIISSNRMISYVHHPGFQMWYKLKFPQYPNSRMPLSRIQQFAKYAANKVILRETPPSDFIFTKVKTIEYHWGGIPKSMAKSVVIFKRSLGSACEVLMKHTYPNLRYVSMSVLPGVKYHGVLPPSERVPKLEVLDTSYDQNLEFLNKYPQIKCVIVRVGREPQIPNSLMHIEVILLRCARYDMNRISVVQAFVDACANLRKIYARNVKEGDIALPIGAEMTIVENNEFPNVEHLYSKVSL